MCVNKNSCIELNLGENMKKITVLVIVIGLLLSTTPLSMGGEEAVEKLEQDIEELEEAEATHNSVFVDIESRNIVDDPSLIPSYVAGELIVKLRDEVEVSLSSDNGILETNIESLDELNNEFGVFSAEKIFKNDQTPSLSKVYKFSLSDNADILSVAQEYTNDSSVEFAEPNYKIICFDTVIESNELNFETHSSLPENNFIPNDPYFTDQWALHNTGQEGGTPDADIDAPEAWKVTMGDEDVVIAILDTGVDYTHPDLSDNIWINADEIP